MKDIIIVGGGSAGWMTAATLISQFPDKNISLIESPNVPTIGVGESTIGGIKSWIELLKINEKEFISLTDASYKLSIKFTDFYKKGESFHYPFGLPNLDNNKYQLNDWWFKKFLYPNTPYSDYVDCIYPQMALVNQNKCFFNENNEIPFNFKKDTAYHFDASKFAIWLRDQYAIPKGVKHIKEDIINIEKDQNGIKCLNNKHKADLFIDCTGFKSLLLEQNLKEPFESYTDLLPNNSAWATRIPYIDKQKELVPYTNCTAIQNGWVWNIPLWSRIGTGYVYSDKFISDEDALIEFKQYLKKEDLEFKNIKMRIGIHNRLWVKNVCAIGLSAGFIEPLESSGLFTVHEFLVNLVRSLQRDKVSQWDKDNFTFQCKLKFKNFAEFVALHYALSHRTDTPYWQANFDKQWSEKIINLKTDLTDGFLDAAIRKDSVNFFNEKGGFHCIAAGMNWGPTDLANIFYKTTNSDINFWKKEWQPLIDNINNKRDKWSSIVENKTDLYTFLKNNYYN